MRKQTKWHGKQTSQPAEKELDCRYITINHFVISRPTVETLTVRSLRHENYGDAKFILQSCPSVKDLFTDIPISVYQKSLEAHKLNNTLVLSSSRGSPIMYNQKTAFCNVLKSGMKIACVIMHKNECRVQDTSSYISTTLEGK